MKTLLTALVAVLLASGAAAAQERAYAIGHARPGMRLAEFRFAPHPAGSKVICSNDATLPPGVTFDVPKPMLTAKVNRCALFADAGQGWRQVRIPLAGSPTDLVVMAVEDEGGLERVAQVHARQPRPGYEQTLAELVSKLGPPAESRPQVARWRSGGIEVMTGHDGYEAQVFMVETRLQALIQSRLDAAKPAKKR